MAEEERSGVQNIWLLFIALGLGLLVVIIYNVHIYKVRQEGRGANVNLLRVTRDIERGEKLIVDDLLVQPVPKQYETSLGNVVPGSNLDFAIGSTVNQPIEKDQWLLWGHITGDPAGNISNSLSAGFVAVAVPLDTKKVPGDILHQNDRVNIVGDVARNNMAPTPCRIIKGARVIAIGGVGPQNTRTIERGSRTASGTSRSYRSITIELPEDVSLEFSSALKCVSGDCWIELISSREPKSPEYNKITQEMKDLMKSQPNVGVAPRPVFTPGARTGSDPAAKPGLAPRNLDRE